jgi:hypothetical protein
MLFDEKIKEQSRHCNIKPALESLSLSYRSVFDKQTQYFVRKYNPEASYQQIGQGDFIFELDPFHFKKSSGRKMLPLISAIAINFQRM